MNLRATVQPIRHFLVIVNKVAMNVDVHISVESLLSIFGGVHSSGLTGYAVVLLVGLPVFRDACLWGHRSVCCCSCAISQLGGSSSSSVRAVLVAQSCPTRCDPMDCGPPGSSVHGILQARILEWIAIPFSRGSSRPRD